MTVLTGVDTRSRLLLRRRATVYLSDGIGAAARSDAGVDLLETDLVDRGWLLAPALRAALAGLDAADLVNVGTRLLADCDVLLGAHGPHVPLFRDFPRSVPDDTFAFFVDRVLVAWFQAPAQPCVLCGADGTVAPVNPCGHLICRACFDGAVFSACPVCHRRIDVDDPFLRPAPARPPAGATPPPQRLRVLHLGTDADSDCRAELRTLLERPGALPPADVDDLTVLLGLQNRDDLAWVPETVPGRETKARLLSWLLADPTAVAAVDRAGPLVDTVTDVLRLLAVRSGGDASLVDRPRLTAVSRPLRRILLGMLDRIPVAQAVEDMRRRRRAWLAVGERLHPGEHAAAYPSAARAFAALRGTAGADRVRVFGAQVEAALAAADAAAVVRLLANRPGELLRRLDHLLRIADDAGFAALLEALPAAAARVSPQVLLSALGEIRTRTAQQASRVFFPAGRTSVAHVIPDTRDALAPDRVGLVVAFLEEEVLRRSAALPRVARAVLDSEVDGLVAPYAERTAARALLTLARGSVLPVPVGRYLRLFCHWTEAEGGPRVDLDLSVALFDGAWQHIDTCDYTHLRSRGAVHSGDLTSAPGPLGASEFIDLDVDKLVAAGAEYAVVAVLSYNNVPFVDMAEAFAGLMLRSADRGRGEVFDPRAVEQRFDLTGPGRMTVPYVVDLCGRSMRWLDVTAKITGTGHAVHRHHDKLGVLARALTEGSAAGSRITLGELGRWHAAARTDEVLVRDPDGTIRRYRRRDGESTAALAARLADPAGGDGFAGVDDAAEAGLQVLIRGDLPVPAGADVYALHPAGLDPAAVRLLSAADFAAQALALCKIENVPPCGSDSTA